MMRKWCTLWKRTAMTTGFLSLFLALNADAAGRRTVNLDFSDSAVTEDTVFTLGAIAAVTCDDPHLRAVIERTVAGTSAPPSFGRFLSVNDFRTRNLGVRYPDVTFTCTGSTRPFIRTAFNVIRVSDFLDLIRKTVRASIVWDQGTCEFTIDNLDDSLRVFRGDVHAGLQGFERPFYPKGKVTLELIAAQAGKTFRMPVRCTFTVAVAVMVAGRDITRGEVVTRDDYELKTVDVTHFSPDPFRCDSVLQGKKAARSIRKGTILHERLFTAIPLVEKGDQISIVRKKRSLSISISGMARESGCAGEKIWVENSVTRKLIHARIIDKGIVETVSGGKGI